MSMDLPLHGIGIAMLEKRNLAPEDRKPKRQESTREKIGVKQVMKTKMLPLMTIAALVVAVSLTACGKTDRASTETAVQTSPVGSALPDPVVITTPPPSTSTSTSTSVVLDAPLSFEFTLNGNQNAITPAFQTDNVLKVKFVPGITQGNSFHSATELAVVLNTNGTDFTPQYTSSNYTYGQVSEQSNVIDMSAYINPGSSIQISIKNPKSDFYCTYAPNPFYYWDGTQYAPTNPLYNVYPGCRKAVFSSHQWSGKLIVQTSHTSSI